MKLTGFPSFFRLRRLYSICSVKKRSWEFFGGSIDTIYTLSMNFLQRIRDFFNNLSVLE
jgi:hypothetical protein